MGKSPELADVIREYGKDYLVAYADKLAPGIHKIMALLSKCRTSALGGHMLHCTDCGSEIPCYNSCRNRHCPKCLGSKISDWLTKRSLELLPVQYFHVVFTIPHELIPLAASSRKEFYSLFFKAASNTLLDVAKNKKHFGAELGFFGILHTWSQTLLLHPHIHFVVPALGRKADGTWIQKENFLLPVKVLSIVFRAKLLELLKSSYAKGNFFSFNKKEFNLILNAASKNSWVIYAKKPFHGPQNVLKYLSRYTHRIAISNKRILAIKNGKVIFSYKDYTDNNKKKVLTISATSFLHRFFLHLVPKNFYRIRYFGFLSNSKRKKAIADARAFLHHTQPILSVDINTTAALSCPLCGSDKLAKGSKINKIAEFIHFIPHIDSS